MSNVISKKKKKFCFIYFKYVSNINFMLITIYIIIFQDKLQYEKNNDMKFYHKNIKKSTSYT